MSHTIKKHQKLPGSIVEVEVEIKEEAIMKHWEHAVGHVSEHLEFPGFRKGHAPEKMVVAKVGEMAILEDCAEHALQDAYSQIIEELKIHPLGSPKVVITKIAKNNPLEATLRISVPPEIKLPDYAKEAKKIMDKTETIEVTDKEVEDVVSEIANHHPKKDELKDGALTDEFVQKLGGFKDLVDFKTKIKENIAKEKEFKAKEKKRIEIIENIRKGSTIDVPEILIENELDKMIHEFSAQLSRTGATLEKYLSEIKKTEEDVRNDWKEKAKERVEAELILFEISKLEKISADPKEVEKEADAMAEHYKNVPKDRILAFVEDALTKEAVFKFLEK